KLTRSTAPLLTRNKNYLMDINESPVYVLLNPAINHAQKDLPVTIYESGCSVGEIHSNDFNDCCTFSIVECSVELHVIDGILQLIFVRSSYTIETVEAERISVGHVAHLKPADGGTAATQCTIFIWQRISQAFTMQLRCLVAELKCFIIFLLCDILCENSLLRLVSSLLRRLQVIESEKFQDDFLMTYILFLPLEAIT
ncbi:hypothetical protein GIB67_035042, partial [Kingdonia uniflora]